MRFEFALYFVLFCSTGDASTQSLSRNIDPALQKEIDDFVNNVYLPYSNTTKLGLSIVQNDGEILYNTGYGMANEAKGIPNSNQTQFLIGSVTKSFTSLVLIKVLHERFPELGEQVLDTPIRKLAPNLNFTLMDRFRSEHGTVRDMLSHRMCLMREDLAVVAEPFSSSSEVLYRQRYAPQECGMRTQFVYNNPMFVMAGELASTLANKSFAQLTNELLTEMEMFNTSMGGTTDDYDNSTYRSLPYYVVENVSYPMNTDLMKRIAPYAPAGGLYVPPNDMAKYLQFHLNKGRVNGRQVIPEEVMAWTTKAANIMPEMYFKSSEDDLVGTSYGYGLGLFLASLDGWKYIYHSGYMSPYSSLMSLFPSQNLGVFTSTNEGPLYVDPSAIHAFVFLLLKGTPAKQATERVMKFCEKEKTIQEAKRMEVVHSLEKLKKENAGKVAKMPREVVGEYGSGATGDVIISEKFNNETNSTQLFIEYGIWYRGWLQSLDGALYQITFVTDIVDEYYSQGDTEASGYVLIENGTLEFVVPYQGIYLHLATFQLGVSLDKLPPIPWNPDSCGPE